MKGKVLQGLESSIENFVTSMRIGQSIRINTLPLKTLTMVQLLTNTKETTEKIVKSNNNNELSLKHIISQSILQTFESMKLELLNDSIEIELLSRFLKEGYKAPVGLAAKKKEWSESNFKILFASLLVGYNHNDKLYANLTSRTYQDRTENGSYMMNTNYYSYYPGHSYRNAVVTPFDINDVFGFTLYDVSEESGTSKDFRTFILRNELHIKEEIKLNYIQRYGQEMYEARPRELFECIHLEKDNYVLYRYANNYHVFIDTSTLTTNDYEVEILKYIMESELNYHRENAANPELAKELLALIDSDEAYDDAKIAKLGGKLSSYFSKLWWDLLFIPNSVKQSNALKGVSDVIFGQQIKRNIESKQNRYKELELQLNAVAKEINHLLGVRTRLTSVDVNPLLELVEYINSYKKENVQILNYSTDSGTITLYLLLHSNLLYFDTEMYETIRDASKRRQNMLSNLSSEQIEMLDDIFVNQRITVPFVQAVSVKINLSGSRPILNKICGDTASYLNKIGHGCFHPHIYYYNCWGENQPHIETAFCSNNYELAIDQMQATIAGINVSDETVFKRFVAILTQDASYSNTMDSFLYGDWKILYEYKTKEYYTIKEYLHLKQIEKEEAEREQKDREESTAKQDEALEVPDSMAAAPVDVPVE